MPHLIVKLWPGRSEEDKAKLTQKLIEAMKESINVTDDSISIALEEIPKEEWNEKVYKQDIMKNVDKLYKKPGYKPEEI